MSSSPADRTSSGRPIDPTAARSDVNTATSERPAVDTGADTGTGTGTGTDTDGSARDARTPSDELTLIGTAPDATRLARRLIVPGIGLGVVVICVLALAIGRFGVPPVEVVRMLVSKVIPLAQTWYPEEATIVFDVRLPRVVLSFLVGAALALGGAVLQGVFRNPLVSPQVLGVSAGASFGGVLAMVTGLGTAYVVGGAFGFGIVALVCVVAFSRIASTAPLLMIVLGGVVVSALFNALVSLLTYVADPYTTLPSITFWLLGSLATASWTKVLTALIPIAIGAVAVFTLRWRLNVLSLGDEDAAALGVSPKTTRNVLLLAVALLTAGAVAVSGVIGWVGLLIPHICRLMVGSDNRVLLPASFLLGGGYLTLVDTLSRTVASVEIPLGILTAVIGAPFFIVLLAKFRKRVWIDD